MEWTSTSWELVVLTVLGSFFNALFSKLLSPYKINVKSIIYWVLKAISTILRYFIPAGYLIYIFITYGPVVDKNLVFTVSFFMAIFVLNLCLDITFYFQNKLIESERKTLSIIDNLKDIDNAAYQAIQDLQKNQTEHVEVTRDFIKTLTKKDRPTDPKNSI